MRWSGMGPQLTGKTCTPSAHHSPRSMPHRALYRLAPPTVMPASGAARRVPGSTCTRRVSSRVLPHTTSRACSRSDSPPSIACGVLASGPGLQTPGSISLQTLSPVMPSPWGRQARIRLGLSPSGPPLQVVDTPAYGAGPATPGSTSKPVYQVCIRPSPWLFRATSRSAAAACRASTARSCGRAPPPHASISIAPSGGILRHSQPTLRSKRDTPRCQASA